MDDFDRFDNIDDPYHARLQARPYTWAIVGVLHTLLTAGIVFGWASLLPILRDEGLDAELTPSQFANIFTHGAIGNYLSSLPFGYILDKYGPKICGVVASCLFATGLLLCSLAHYNTICLDAGITLVGFAGPAIQLPTLHLSRLFPGESREGGNGGAALFMSAQAGAFDGGTMVFALYSVLARAWGMSTSLFFRLYVAVPVWTLMTALLAWPHEILPDMQEQTPLSRRSSYLGAASPYLSPANVTTGTRSTLKDAPLSTILSRPPFYCLAIWVSIHILKLNFVVATINDQLQYSMPNDQQMVNPLINTFGAMLPFGFVVLPAVAYLLSKSTLMCFQVANAVGVIYGSVLAFLPDQTWYMIFLVFPSVACSRQLVYSTVFHQTGNLFGFRNYGVLLGLTNIVVSAASMVQGPLVERAETRQDYFGANLLLLLLTTPLFVIVYWTTPCDTNVAAPKGRHRPCEATGLLDHSSERRPRSLSDAVER